MYKMLTIVILILLFNVISFTMNSALCQKISDYNPYLIEVAFTHSPHKEVSVINKNIRENNIQIHEKQAIQGNSQPTNMLMHAIDKKPSSCKTNKDNDYFPQWQTQKRKKTNQILYHMIPYAIYKNQPLLHTIQKEDYHDLIFNAAARGEIAALHKLLSIAPDLEIRNQDGDTPLIHATKASSIDSIRLLLLKGANYQAKDQQGNTALMIAYNNHRVDIVHIIRVLSKARHTKFADISTISHDIEISKEETSR